MNRTQAAFTLSADTLFTEAHGKLYFWTFTFKSVPLSDQFANEDWAYLRKRLLREWPHLKGLRVTELHRSHGIHYHALVNMRIPIRRVMALAKGNGHLTGRNRYLDFGRMTVDECDPGTVGYLCKYLRKGYVEKNRLYGGRRWGAFGDWQHSRGRDIVYDSAALRNRKEMFKDAAVGYGALMMIQHYTNLWGHWAEWPKGCQMLVRMQKGNRQTEWMRSYDKEIADRRSTRCASGSGDGNADTVAPTTRIYSKNTEMEIPEIRSPSVETNVAQW